MSFFKTWVFWTKPYRLRPFLFSCKTLAYHIVFGVILVVVFVRRIGGLDDSCSENRASADIFPVYRAHRSRGRSYLSQDVQGTGACLAGFRTWLTKAPFTTSAFSFYLDSCQSWLIALSCL